MKQFLRELKSKIFTWIKNNKSEFRILSGILALSAFVRLWRIPEYLPFLGDEGRDVRIVARFLTEFHPMLLGPRTSIGDMYLGPLYYYLISPFLALWQFSPVGPAVFVALLGITTVWLIWYVGREWFGVKAGLIGSFLFAISPVVINLSKHSWNPNIMPFFSLLAIYSVWQIWEKKNFKWLVVLGITFAVILQSHYLGLLLLPTIGVIWLLTLRTLKGSKEGGSKKFLLYSLLSIFLFILLMSPLVIFDAKHGWHNFASMKVFFADRQTTVSAKPWNAIPTLWPLWDKQIVSHLMLADNTSSFWLSFLILVGGAVSVYRLYRRKLWQSFRAICLLGLWVGVGLFGLGLYKQAIYDHYFGFMFAAPFLLFGAVSQVFWDRRRKWLVIALVIVLGIINLNKNPLKDPPQRQLQRVQEIDRKIIEKSQNKPFNFALIAKRNYEDGYLYFFERWGVQVRQIEAQQLSETLTNQLFVVCEDPVCEPINNPKAEIANFGWARIETQEDIQGVKLFKLVHTQNN